ncbi:MAG TPA: serine/threonine-protein kinase [Polyangiaceae bacterium]|nr:serine/threonine-protein kinase [Polyangiaceae bacterium]
MAQPAQRYKVLERIAAGGMAEVFRAESAGLEGFKKLVAIKRVLPHLSEKKQFIGMFLDEARVGAHLSHSNCVQVFDIGVGDNTYFIVMEFVDGSDLKGVIEHRRTIGQPVPVEEACLITVRICEGLAYAHELVDNKGQSLHIVHRDMSPPNVLLTRHGEVKIVDFGLAKANSQLEKSEPGIIKGKFSYLSPEAAQGLPVDARTDVFAVGIILWEMLAGRRLFLGESDLETVRMVQRAEIPPLRAINPKVPLELERVLAKGLAADPARRYQTAREFGRDLNQILFHIGRAVSSFDIAQLVLPIWRDRQRKKKDKVDKGAIIGSLIDEALFEFSSLENDNQGNKSTVGSLPVSLGSFEDVHNWGDEMSNEPPAVRDVAPMSYELGNLAALEDDTPPPLRQSSPLASVRSPSQTGGHSAVPHAAPFVDDEPEPQLRGGKNRAIGVIVIVLAAAAAVGAWFGLVPHH